MKLSNQKIMLLTGCMLGMATLLMESCATVVKYDLDPICGNWASVGNKPDVLIFKEGEQYKVTIFRKVGISRKVKPETYLIVQESGNMFINTGFRIDIAYNEATDVLSFSPNGDYTRTSNNE